MSKGSDQVFQLSLTEIAFTIAFILLLLLGFMIFSDQKKLEEAAQMLAKQDEIEQKQENLEQAREDLAEVLKDAGSANPDEMISNLVEANRIREERDRLLQQIKDLDARITALAEVQKVLDQAAAGAASNAAMDEIVTALALQAGVRKAIAESEVASAGSAGEKSREVLEAARGALDAAKVLRDEVHSKLGTTVTPGRESETIRQLVSSVASAADSGDKLQIAGKENADLRGQIAFLRNRLDARGGRDYPPCWADESGKVQFLFNVDLKPNVVEVSAGWPPTRDADARLLPGLDEVLSGPAPLEQFVTRIRGIFDWSTRQDPECRHYVRLKSSIPDAVLSDRSRLKIEEFFYKTEIRR
jgi:hypothetical protein